MEVNLLFVVLVLVFLKNELEEGKGGRFRVFILYEKKLWGICRIRLDFLKFIFFDKKLCFSGGREFYSRKLRF